MLPDGVLSTDAVIGNFIGGRAAANVSNYLDYEDGGVALNDPSQGLLYQVWKARLTVSGDVMISAPNTPETLLYSGADITEISLTFDQNMRPALAFVQNDIAKLRWYDTLVSAQVVTEFDADVITPRVFLDDKRALESLISDIILVYSRGGSLYYRQQRDRFLNEYLLAADIAPKGIRKVGMNSKLRLQVQINA